MTEKPCGGLDVEALADKTAETLSISPGQVIWIWASTHSLDLVEALAYRIRNRGAFWVLRLIIESLLSRIGQSVPERYLGLVPKHEIRWLADVDAIVEINDHSGHVPDIPVSRRRAMAAEWLSLIDESARRGCRRIVVMNPTCALASAYSIPVETLRQRCWQAISVDYAALDRQQKQVQVLLARTRDVHITSQLGTDLHLSVDGRPVHVDRHCIPRGEVYVAPHEHSANGVVMVDLAFIGGKPVEQLRLTFCNGRLTGVEARDSNAVTLLLGLLAASTGDKDAIGEFAIGLNPGVSALTGITMLDEKMGGSIHIAIGMNEHFGGRNKSNLHVDFVVPRPVVQLDGIPVIRDGSLVASLTA
jgi:aminopeptidase